MEEEEIKKLAKLFIKAIRLQAELNQINELLQAQDVDKVSFADSCVYVTIGEKEYVFNGEEFWKEE